MRHGFPLTLALCLALFYAPVQAKSLADCRALKDAEARLACYDALETSEAIAPHELLTQLLGDPEAIGKDYDFIGNASAIGQALPGRWLIGPWKLLYDLMDEETLTKVCGHQTNVVEPLDGSRFAFTVSRESPKLGSFHTHDIILSTHSRFAHATDIEGTLSYLGIDPEKHGLQMAEYILRRAVSEWTYLPLSDDVFLLIDSANGENAVMVRCPEAG